MRSVNRPLGALLILVATIGLIGWWRGNGAIAIVLPESTMPAVVQMALLEFGDWELLSLDPADRKENPPGGFHGFVVLGKTRVNHAATQAKLIQAVFEGTKKGLKIDPAACFEPRHGLRLKHQGKNVDLVLCFECHTMKVYGADQKAEVCLVDDSPETTFTQVLREAKVPLPKPAN